MYELEAETKERASHINHFAVHLSRDYNDF